MTDRVSDVLRWNQILLTIQPNPLSKDPTGYNAEELERIQHFIIKNNDSALAYYFALEFDYKRNKMLNLILKQEDAKYAHLYIKNIDNSVANKVKKIIIDSEKPSYLFELAKHLDSIYEISKIEDLIIRLKSYTYIRLFAQHIKKANIDKLEQAILESDNLKEIKKFAINVRESKMKQFLLVS